MNLDGIAGSITRLGWKRLRLCCLAVLYRACKVLEDDVGVGELFSSVLRLEQACHRQSSHDGKSEPLPDFDARHVVDVDQIEDGSLVSRSRAIVQERPTEHAT
ncbi:hypothetical protein PHBOTO_000857 [Pseudozyma hubeiensis]|nr:hypothetical protein PHBOTO_000857 [Pseudozyma hubeiensis]